MVWSGVQYGTIHPGLVWFENLLTIIVLEPIKEWNIYLFVSRILCTGMTQVLCSF